MLHRVDDDAVFVQVHSITLGGEWDDESAGGCDLNPMWKKNPKLILLTQMPSEFRITVRRLGAKQWRKGSGIDNMLGFYILRAENSLGEISVGAAPYFLTAIQEYARKVLRLFASLICAPHSGLQEGDRRRGPIRPHEYLRTGLQTRCWLSLCYHAGDICTWQGEPRIILLSK